MSRDPLHRQSGTPRWHKKARDLREAHPDWSLRRIADELGVTGNAVWKTLNRERARELARRDNKTPAGRERRRRWRSSDRGRGRCECCGTLKGIGTNVGADAGHYCRACWMGIRDTCASLVEGMWSNGWTTAEIAETCGYANAASMHQQLIRLRNRGYDLPRRGPGGVIL